MTALEHHEMRTALERIEALERQLLGCQDQIETYRQRERACYEALGYAPDCNEALPSICGRIAETLDEVRQAVIERDLAD